MKKLVSASLMVVLILCGSAYVSNVHASTSVGGLVTSDTVWASAGSPYTLTGAVGVVAGVTLTIAPGTTVDLAGYYMEINGTLIAQGTSDNNIVFLSPIQYTSQCNPTIEFMPSSTSWNEQTASGSIIENAFFQTASVSIQGCSPKISRDTFNNTVDTSINIVSGSPLISDNVVDNPPISGAILANGGSKVTNNQFDTTRWTYVVTAGDSASLSNNVVNGGWISVILNGQATFNGNTVINCVDVAIQSLGSAVIQQNYVANNKCGISVGGGTVEGNTITGNKVGIQCAGSASIVHNNIYGNTQYSVYLTGSSNVDASGNWWGTTDTQAISQSIYDSKSDFTLGTVTYTPILNQPSSEAPSSPLVPVTLPTPTPQTTSPQSTATFHPTATPTLTPNQWQNSIGAGSSGPENSVESVILQLAKIVPVALAFAWAVVIVVFVRRRLKTKSSQKA